MDDALGILRDKLGPAKVVLLHDPAAHLDAVVVLDNLAAGVAIGGSAWPPTSPWPRWPAWPAR